MRRVPWWSWTCLLLSLPALAASADLDGLLAGVGEVTAPGAIPGPVVAYSPESFAILPGKYQSARAPIVAGARAGAGRVVIAGHGALIDGVERSADNAALAVNTVRWLAAGKPAPRVGLHGSRVLRERLVADGATVRELADHEVVGALGELDVVVTSGHSWTRPEDTPVFGALQEFVRQGGGLLVSACAWGWQQLNPGHDLLTEFAGNRLVLPLGLAFTDQMVGTTGPHGWVADRDGLDRLAAQPALAELLNRRQKTKGELAELTGTLSLAARSLPPDEPVLMTRLNDLVAGARERAVPSPNHPVADSDGLARLAIVMETRRLRQLPAAEVPAHPAAKIFPGEVPADALRVSLTLPVDRSVPGWHSTGLYAVPGEALTVTVPAEAARQKLGLRIGCHTDRLWHLDKWKRLPEISFEVALQAGDNAVASPYGGLVYVTVPDNQTGTATVTIAGGVRAPLFVLGETDPAAWRETIRQAPGPWAELATDRVVISVPSAEIRELDDPTPLLEFWNRVLDACADLAQIPHERRRPERYVPDEQISAGYMHSGYPIMTWMDAAPRFVDLERLQTQGDWGMFHEMGHNHQSGYWTFSGTVEVTTNLFSVYVMETVCGQTGDGYKRSYDEKVTRRMTDYFAAGSPFDQWKRDPFLALRMYLDLQAAFGWEPFKVVFKAYRDAPKDELPQDDDAKRDQWLVRMSRQVGHNLGPYFQRWGVPTSDAARASVADLPPWMPAGYPEG